MGTGDEVLQGWVLLFWALGGREVNTVAKALAV